VMGREMTVVDELLKSNGRPVRRWLSIVPFVVLATLHNQCGTRPSQPLPLWDQVRRAATQLESKRAGPKMRANCAFVVSMFCFLFLSVCSRRRCRSWHCCIAIEGRAKG
jgi:hypothetical protein